MLNYLKEHSYDIFKMIMYQFMMAFIGVIMSMATHTNDTVYLLTSIVYTIVYFAILYLMTYEIGEKDRPAIVGNRAEFMPLKGFWMSVVANIPNIVFGLMVVIFSFFLVYQQPVAVVNDAGENVEVFVIEEDKQKAVTLYSDSGNTAVTSVDGSYKYPSEIMGSDSKKTTVYDKDGNELEFYTESGEQLSTKQKIIENWATNLHSVPYVILTFFQIFYAGIRNVIFNDSIYVFLVTPILPILFSTLGYYFGVKEKRIFFFLPERKRKPPKYK